MIKKHQPDFIFPCKVTLSDHGWKCFGQKERYPVKDRVGVALGESRGKFTRGYIRVKWSNVKNIQYYLPSYLKDAPADH